MVCSPLPKRETLSFDDAAKVLAALRAQETSYRCGDYFDRSKKEHELGISSRPGILSPLNIMDVGCRQILCDWCYNVCDVSDLNLNREMVAVAFSYVDRFIDRQPSPCDRPSFKLAVVTGFYIATKIMSSKQISISSLCALGRGSFTFNQVLEMERLLLTSLDWRMNPPTAQTMVACIRTLVPTSVSPTVTEAITQRAIFFTELAVYDPYFIPTSRYLLAVASFINAMEYLENMLPSEKESLKSFPFVLCIRLDGKSLRRARVHLWSLYHDSTQGREEKMIARAHDPPRHLSRIDDNMLLHPNSPRSVEIMDMQP
jgi:Cyclin, N-terminal domain